jgi:hypothetical protein
MYKYAIGKTDTSVKIPETVEIIDDFMFEECDLLVSIDIPNSVTDIEWYVFLHCSSLESINFGGTIEQWNSIKFGSYWNLQTGDYTIYCTNGEIAKDGTVTYYY